MDIAATVTSALSSLGISTVAATWLSKQWVTHQYQKELESHKLLLSQELEAYKAELSFSLEARKTETDLLKLQVENELRERTESNLGAKNALIEYEFSARKRLYEITGPLRFQLLLATRDFAERMKLVAIRDYSLSLSNYFGRTTIYRLLRVVALTELIERQTAVADFSVDSSCVSPLRLRKAAFTCMSGEAVVATHPRINWNRQEEHLFTDSLWRASHALVSTVDARSTVSSSYDFEIASRDQSFVTLLSPLPDLFENFRPESKPLLWTRLVAFGYVCNEYVNAEGSGVGFENHPYELEDLLLRSRDQYVRERIESFAKKIRDVAVVRL